MMVLLAQTGKEHSFPLIPPHPLHSAIYNWLDISSTLIYEVYITISLSEYALFCESYSYRSVILARQILLQSLLPLGYCTVFPYVPTAAETNGPVSLRRRKPTTQSYPIYRVITLHRKRLTDHKYPPAHPTVHPSLHIDAILDPHCNPRTSPIPPTCFRRSNCHIHAMPHLSSTTATHTTGHKAGVRTQHAAERD